ncbi:DctP family TRAP transporter solute-binding subunit [Synechococcus sp. PCC 6312]|uniref:DctP family TRAP transporter solute-binding subunit n=1 Tax=Synechococcus sp. (strain ATCC 27167 / PCC 6312) TaxID=195253 RepID=UPI00029ED73F|nr:DctP family TRAP transporter solute-binding subunit [Synechococcus sp. PCC 6312]AFY60506.1 tripartite ATP-independent periplasmic transporter solute receptor, DctP family [Synechococcus sp. PCC 6312]
MANISRRKFLTLASATALTAMGASRLHAGESGQTLEQALDQRLPFPGQYGKDYNQAKIKAFHLHNQSLTSPLHQSLLDLWQDVFQKTNGELLVTPLHYDASLPAGDPQAVRLVAEGRFELVSVAGPIIDKLCPQAISIQNFPFLYQSAEDVYQIINQPQFPPALNQAVANYNLTYLRYGTFDNGMRVITSIESKPIRTIQDLVDLKIRIPPSNDMKATMEALGAKTEAFTMNQVYGALAKQLVQAQENPYAVAMNFELYKVTKYLNLTNHAWSGYNIFFNTKFWRSLSQSTRDIVTELMPIYQAKNLQAQRDFNKKVYQQLIQDKGMIVTQPDMSQAPQKLTHVYQSIYGQLNPLIQPLVKDKLSALTGLRFS